MRKTLLTVPAVILIASLASAGEAEDSKDGSWVTEIRGAGC
jgi:hypothetical protein